MPRVIGAAARGERAQTWIDVDGALPGSVVRIPVHVARGAADGPVAVLFAGIHGDEWPGVAYAREMYNVCAPHVRRGALVTVPIGNPIAYWAGVRSIDEDTGLYDLNRSFPGKGDSTAQKIAAALTAHVLAGADALVDLHHGGWGETWGMVGVFVDASPPVSAASMRLAEAFGYPLIKRSVATGVEGSAVSYVARVFEKPAISVCIGGAGWSLDVEQRWVRHHVDGLARVLEHLGIADEGTAPRIGEPLQYFQDHWRLRATRAGALVVDAPRLPGDRVRAGDVLATLVDPATFDVLETYTAPRDGTLFAVARSAVVRGGRQLFAAAVPEAT